jgi:hypothetical protein
MNSNALRRRPAADPEDENHALAWRASEDRGRSLCWRVTLAQPLNYSLE